METQCGEIDVSAQTEPSPAHFVGRKPGGIITLTSLFLMFIHLPKYIRQISGNNEDLLACPVWHWLCLLRRIKKWPILYCHHWNLEPLTTATYYKLPGALFPSSNPLRCFVTFFGFFLVFFMITGKINIKLLGKDNGFYGRISTHCTVIELLLHYFVSTQGWGNGCIVITTVRIPSHLGLYLLNITWATQSDLSFLLSPASCIRGF